MRKIILLSLFFPVFCFGQWVQLGNSINGQVAFDGCGWSTAISANGTIVAMGAISNDNGGSNAGQVRVFGLSNGVWSQIGADLNGETFGDQTGQAVSLSADGSIVAIGEPFNNDLGFVSGQVRVFRNINNNWSQIGQDLFGQNSSAEAGKSVDLSADGSILAFGAPNTTVNGVFFAGKVKVFENQNNNWIQKGGDIDGDGSIIKFGSYVSLSDNGNIIAIGQTGDPSNSNPQDTGRVKVYQFVGNQWVQLGNTIKGSIGRDEFGHRVSLSAAGNILAIGTFGRNEVKVFELIGGVWTQIGNTLAGEGSGDAFGGSLSLSHDGSVIAIGGRFNSTDGTSRGRAYVFKNQGGNWTLVDNPIIGVANGDQNGFSIAISQNGSRVAIGALNNDDGGSNAGQVRIFENTVLIPIKLLYFGGNYYNNAVKLNWQYETQTNFSHFVVEKSLDGTVFNKLDNIYLTNTRFYNYTDSDIKQGTIYYYRLKLVDKDGKFTYSNIIKIQTGAVNTFSVLSNPVKDNLSMTGLKRGATLGLYDNAGKMVLQRSIQDQSFSLNLSFLSSGVYYLKYSNNGAIETTKIIKL
jgi:Secretion system C-terminal sorting domain/FG-GAP repeat